MHACVYARIHNICTFLNVSLSLLLYTLYTHYIYIYTGKAQSRPQATYAIARDIATIVTRYPVDVPVKKRK